MLTNVEGILNKLKARYPEAQCELNFDSEFELLIAVILSAQCTDKRVNIITEKLFKIYSTPEAFAALEPEELIPHIRSCGFFNNKARSIIEASRDILGKFGGRVPSTMEELLSLRGVGRKTANVMLAFAFNQQAIAVDTHVFRVSNRLGLVSENTPERTETALRQVLPPDKYSESHHLLLFHGRYTCKSRKPECGNCNLTGECKYFSQKEGELLNE